MCKQVFRDFDFEGYPLGEDSHTELLVNEYKQEDDLRFHFDHRFSCKEVIFGVSFCSNCILSFQHDLTREILDVQIPVRTLNHMTGDSRFVYKHGMRSFTLSGTRRVSFTLRVVEEEEKRLRAAEKKMLPINANKQKSDEGLFESFMIIVVLYLPQEARQYSIHIALECVAALFFVYHV